ncbi:D-glycerate dehydrogenase [Candidatus Uhrbacteria bacterium]|jgi:glyoxylate reductase|nr:D-glycerate dehydrogenase [Candidatus Uhrbacteria bacterium]MBT7716814.1 D-glycerate dehydrogenase [Candidatus Uhrbacteria bacterium]
MTKIFVTRQFPGTAIEKLSKQKGFEVSVYKKDQIIPRKELLKRVKGADIILSLLTDRIDAQVMDAAGDQLKMIANYAVGFDNIDIEEAKRRKIRVINTPCDQSTESVAEHAIAMIFGLAHRLIEADNFTRAKKYKGWDPGLMLGSGLSGKTIGVIGAGRIGYSISKRLYDGFGVKIIYNDIKRNTKYEKDFKAKLRTKTQLLKEADIVTLHVPLLKATHHLISTKELKAMKKTAFLINTSRGPVVDETELIKALKNGDIAGAGLDVYECEPKIDCNPRDKFELRKMPNVILTPHTASATIEARDAMGQIALKNILAFTNNKRLPNKIA